MVSVTKKAAKVGSIGEGFFTLSSGINYKEFGLIESDGRNFFDGTGMIITYMIMNNLGSNVNSNNKTAVKLFPVVGVVTGVLGNYRVSYAKENYKRI
jgi:hypothetical protein